MPEGPTIRNVADRLRNALVGQKITEVRSRYKKAREEDWPSLICGATITGTRSHGKNLFIDLSNGYSIYSHMLMWGSWRLYKPGQPWEKEERLARLVLETPQIVAVLFNAPICELIPPGHLHLHKTSALGPDILSPDFDAGEVWRRMTLPENRDREVGDVIMDQYLIAGIGNILKSEILFQAGLHPQRTVASLSSAEFDNLIQYSLKLCRRAYELKGFKRAFLPEEYLPPEIHGNGMGFVYRHRNKPCFICGTPIEMVRQGTGERLTWFCPSCQPFEGKGLPLHLRLPQLAG